MCKKLKNDYSKMDNNDFPNLSLCTSTLTPSFSLEKLTKFFEDHLKEQPEVVNPEIYPHVLPPKDRLEF